MCLISCGIFASRSSFTFSVSVTNEGVGERRSGVCLKHCKRSSYFLRLRAQNSPSTVTFYKQQHVGKEKNKANAAAAPAASEEDDASFSVALKATTRWRSKIEDRDEEA